jgi:flagellar protein FliO/FliZ
MKTQATVTQPTVDSTSPLVQVSGALLGVILLILAAAWLVKRVGFGGIKPAGSQGLKVSASTSLGPRERVVIVNVDDARLVLGVTASQVTLLHTLPPAPVEREEQKTAAPDFSSIMKNIMKRSGRS